MPQSLANLTIDQSVEFLANRQVGLRYSCAPSLEKFAQNPTPDAPTPDAPTPDAPAPDAPAPDAPAPDAPAPDAPTPDAPVGSTLAAFLARPEVMKALSMGAFGAVGGGIVGVLAGLRRKKERRNLLRDALTGAIAGGVGLGGLSLATNSLFAGLDGGDLPEGFPATVEEMSKFRAQYGSEAEATAAFKELFGGLTDQQRVNWAKLDLFNDDGSGIWGLPEMLWKGVKAPFQAGAGWGRLGGQMMHMDGEAHPAWETVGGLAGGTALGGFTGSVAANAINRPLDFSRQRLQSIGEAGWGAGATGKQGVTADAQKIQGLWDTHMRGVPATEALKLQQSLMGTADAKSNTRLSNLLLGQDFETDAGVVKADTVKSTRTKLLNFLNEIRDKERKFSPEKADLNKTWANISVPDARLGHVSGAVQHGKIKGLNRVMGMNPEFRNNIPVKPKNLLSFNLPQFGPGKYLSGGRKLGIPAAIAAGGYWLNHEYNKTDAMAPFRPAVEGYLNPEGDNK